MKLIHIIQVVEIAKTGSMNKAAQNLFISQPNLSASIKELENELNISIFTRSHKGVSLTKIGEQFLKYAETIMENIDYIKTLTTNTFKNNVLNLNISAPSLLFVQDIFVKLCLKYNNNTTNFNLKTNKALDIINDLNLGKSDIGIISFSNKQENFYLELFKKKRLEYTEIFTETIHINLGPTNPLYHKESFNLKDCAEFPLVVSSYGYYDKFLPLFKDIGFEPLSVIRVDNMDNILNIISSTNIIHLGLKFHDNVPSCSIKSIPLNFKEIFLKLAS
ncbi:DNA-binding transcriptional regulator, LysR family [Desulfonispora thiosulfatigenes DSM 11270]|uniref:DNA-binding transcriptional regulator, LysR family n=1 Tax=Desulfonispora thiosulfatigenes DSM 11270 TaxID=656914 RepID=A0A1W1VB09_DESTI|nr:LysR family transcriptional regulator [Desulfonispora thiosulfatigenes]SMB90542.1 DNA-binding transcriptional regulator, LysR family [Desulfonispora thiosulfatigenes DSM 11270]